MPIRRNLDIEPAASRSLTAAAFAGVFSAALAPPKAKGRSATKPRGAPTAM